MKRIGFTLIEVIVGLFLVGLIATVSLPIFQNSMMNFNRVKQRQHMLYLCEMTVERLRGKDSSLESIFLELENSDEVITSTVGSTDLEKYKCRITKTKETELMMNLAVRIYIDKEEGKGQYVEYKTVVKK